MRLSAPYGTDVSLEMQRRNPFELLDECLAFLFVCDTLRVDSSSFVFLPCFLGRAYGYLLM